jgi:DNA-binding NarL/FixJ family response regulator
MIAAGLVSTSFLNMGIGIAQDREDRTLKRLRGTPIPATAYSGAEAVAMAAVLLPDVVLMDLRMPGVDGVTATGRIVAANRAIRVVVLTTYETDADILRAVEAGAVGYLLKDASPTQLAGAVLAAARRRRCPPARSRCCGWSAGA